MTAKKADPTPTEEAPAVAVQRPTLGRIVHVSTSDTESGRAMAAIVTVTPDEDGDQLHVCVFDPVFGPRNYVLDGPSPNYPPPNGMWAWPPARA